MSSEQGLRTFMENAQPVHVTNPRHAPENYNFFKGSWSSELQEVIQGVAGVDICAALPIYSTYTSQTSTSAALPIIPPTPPRHQPLLLLSSPIAIPPDFNPVSTSQKSVHISVLAKEKSETISY